MRMMIKQKKMPMVVMVKPRVANGGDDDQTEEKKEEMRW